MVTTETALLTVKVGYDRQAERDALSTLLGQAGLQAVHRAVAEEDQTKLSVSSSGYPCTYGLLSGWARLWLVGRPSTHLCNRNILMHACDCLKSGPVMRRV